MARLGFSNEDFLNLIIVYGECDRVLNRTCDVFAERYPNVPRATPDILRRLLSNCRNFGSFKTTTMNKIKPITENEENVINILAYFTAYPQASLNDAQRDLGIQYVSIYRVLKKHKYHPFSYQLVQHLKPGDYERRVFFCEWLLIKCQENENFLKNVIWSDEAKFTKNGLFNRHNSHYWHYENPHVIRERQYQEYWSFNVFCAIRNNQIIAVHFYDDNLNGLYFRFKIISHMIISHSLTLICYCMGTLISILLFSLLTIL